MFCNIGYNDLSSIDIRKYSFTFEIFMSFSCKIQDFLTNKMVTSNGEIFRKSELGQHEQLLSQTVLESFVTSAFPGARVWFVLSLASPLY